MKDVEFEHLRYVRLFCETERDRFLCEWWRVSPRDEMRFLCRMSALHCFVKCKCLIITIIHLFINWIDFLHNPAILQVEANLCRFFLLFVYICIDIWDRIFKTEKGIATSSTDLTPTHVCACPKPVPGSPTLYLTIFFKLCSAIWCEMYRFVLLMLAEMLTIAA